MRIWSLHPCYLDAKGLVALWRETLLAKKVLEGNTRGYTRHPQLLRFRNARDPLEAINSYLSFVIEEAQKRGYAFNREKIIWEKCSGECPILPVTSGQLEFERKHLFAKLEVRDPDRFAQLKSLPVLEPHPVFELVEGEVEDWEILG